MKLFVFNYRRQVEAKAKRRLVGTLESQSLCSAASPGDQVRFPEAMKVDCEIEVPSPEIPDEAENARQRVDVRAVSHANSIDRKDFIDCRTHTCERDQTCIRQERKMTLRQSGFEKR